MTIYTMGLSISHNGAAVLLENGQVLVGIEVERVTRQKGDGYDRIQSAIDYCFEATGLARSDLSCTVYATTEFLCPRERYGVELNHHMAHAASAFFTAPFEEAAILVIDGSGNPEYWSIDGPRPGHCRRETRTLFEGRHNQIKQLAKDYGENIQNFDLGIGGAFEFLAQQFFGNPMESGKVMGLAAYGRPRNDLPKLYDPEDGGFRIGWFTELRDLGVIDLSFEDQLAKDLAFQAQDALEAYLYETLNQLARLSGSKKLCYAGGVALNCVANGKLLPGPFDDVFIQPAANDAGLALGCALFGYHVTLGQPRSLQQQRRIFFGRPYEAEQVRDALRRYGPAINLRRLENPAEVGAELLVEGKILGWFQGGSEFGPRALGHRSILCDPRREDAKEILNRSVKHREAFRPFAASVLESAGVEWFEAFRPSAHMVLAFDVRRDRRSRIPGVVHVDGSCRLQTVSEEADPKYHALIQAFYRATGIPMVINTSFNVKGEPIVETPKDAVNCFLRTNMDALIIGDILIVRGAFADDALGTLRWRMADDVRLVIDSLRLWLERPTAHPRDRPLSPDQAQTMAFGLEPFGLPSLDEPWRGLLLEGWIQLADPDLHLLADRRLRQDFA